MTTDEQLDQWDQEYRRITAWYVDQCRRMKWKLKRIMRGELVYRTRNTQQKTIPRAR